MKLRPDKEESRRIRVAIRHVLLGTWDPIGIRDEPLAQDEYDMYIGDVYELLIGDAPDEKIAEYLLWVSTERMGFTRSERAISVTAETVRELRRIQLSSA